MGKLKTPSKVPGPSRTQGQEPPSAAVEMPAAKPDRLEGPEAEVDFGIMRSDFGYEVLSRAACFGVSSGN